MKLRTVLVSLLVLLVGSFLFISPVAAKAKPSLDKWKPDFDPKGAKYRCIVSNVSTPGLVGTLAGFEIRDEVWKRTNGQVYVDFKPYSILGGEVEVLNMLQMGAVQGMGVSSVASTNLGPRFGIVNLPFLVNSFDKLEKFIGNKTIFNHFLMAMDHQGITGLDITGYGNYGWATTIPVRNIEDAKKVKFRIAEAAVNQLSYRNWGFNPVSMPWPDVPVALKQGVITGLDHTLTVCNVTKKFEVAKYFTQINYAQGLFIWIFNKAWLAKLPADIREAFISSVHDICAQSRIKSLTEENTNIEKAKAAGVEFFQLSDADMATLLEQSKGTYDRYAPEINQLYPGDTYKSDNFLKDVQDFLQ
ncbi:TRAP transporter substrate-binding protein [Desulfobacula sp.]|uniref:TRAP transporter substrate-binding protein n=1 Tax=Desulfobacula sp. TaxID=2593537 RepID=UPI00262FCD01|nr:TRAP transporter substrate-binding protein [Desulfobacula sp.]